MPILRQFAQLGHPVLRQKAREVEDPAGPRVQALIADMLYTLADFGGQGLAAPQVHEPLRIIIIASHCSPFYPDAPAMEPTVMLNPVLVRAHGSMVKGWEGCKSVPGIRALVPRWECADVRYQDPSGQWKELALPGFPARIFQHELDHLEGLCFLDRIESTGDIVMEQELAREMKKGRPVLSAEFSR